MTRRARTFAAVLLISGGLITTGVGQWSAPAALIVAGIVLAVWGWLVLSE